MFHSQRTQTTYNYNVGWEASFPHGIVLSAGYVGSRGLFLPLAGPDLNQLDLGTIAKYKDALINTWCPTSGKPHHALHQRNYGSPTVPLWVALQQFPQFGQDGGCCGKASPSTATPAATRSTTRCKPSSKNASPTHFTTLTSFTWAKIITDDGNPPLGFVGFHNGAAQDWKNMNLRALREPPGSQVPIHLAGIL
jgi:hypothetical protein